MWRHSVPLLDIGGEESMNHARQLYCIGIGLISIALFACSGGETSTPERSSDTVAAADSRVQGKGMSPISKGVREDTNPRLDQQFAISIEPRIYQEQSGRGIVIPRNQFRDNFAPAVVDADNGVTGAIDLQFPFRYDNQTYSQIYISVDGWMSFRNPGAFITKDPFALFSDSQPELTIAPYFGDHYLRTAGFDVADPQGVAYTPSTIRVVSDPTTFVVEWENMNINYRFDPTQPDNPFAPVANVKPRARSVASFQAWLFRGDTTGTPCGEPSRIEFHYAPLNTEGPVKLSGASVGIESAARFDTVETTSFLNGVAWQVYRNSDSVRLSRRLTRIYPPTGFPGMAFQFAPPRACDTSFVFQLTWNKPNTDLDLFLIREANGPGQSGDTVYWGQKSVGQNAAHSTARLDVDDINGFGPETIRYRCEPNRSERLRIAMHYHGPVGRGGIPVQATVKMLNGTTGKMLAQFGPCTINPQEWWEVMTVAVPGPTAQAFNCGSAPHGLMTSRKKTVQ